MKIILIPCGATEWHESGRLLGRAEVSLTGDGRSRLDQWVELLRAAGPARIFHSSDELASETAKVLAEQLDISAKALPDLDEVDVGLWAGLTEEQLRARYTSAFRQLCDAPMSVSPPEGETLADATTRLTGCLHRKVSRNGQPALAFVLRPLALAIARCELEGRPFSELWEEAKQVEGPIVIDCAQPAATRTRKKDA